ncbi:MAG: hypothetical protein J7M25_08040 [Deltaproteobacteria bacterium]|nr:hypothetical protein [Deltaproteobacteria bacterium]
MLPSFTSEGHLPPADYTLTLDELRASMLVVGPSNGYPNWDRDWRGHLVESLAVLVDQLWQVGIDDIFIDGSFVEDKEHPNDIDGYFVCDLMELATGRLQTKLNLLDPHKVWTWDPATRRPYHGYPKKQLPMWHAYRVEMYPHVGQLSGICDKHGNNELEFPSAFRLSRRDGEPRGIVKIIKGGQP